MEDFYRAKGMIPGERASLYYEDDMRAASLLSSPEAGILSEQGMHIRGERRGNSDRTMERYFRGEDV